MLRVCLAFCVLSEAPAFVSSLKRGLDRTCSTCLTNEKKGRSAVSYVRGGSSHQEQGICVSQPQEAVCGFRVSVSCSPCIHLFRSFSLESDEVTLDFMYFMICLIEGPVTNRCLGHLLHDMYVFSNMLNLLK